MVLRRDASEMNRPTTARARHGKRRGIGLIHPRWNRSPAATSIGGTCPPARSPAATLRTVLRKRGGLSKARTARRVELVLETLASSLPSIAIACRAGQLVTQAGNLILVALDQLVAFVARRSCMLVGYACVMSYPRKLYKPNSLDLLPSPAKQRPEPLRLSQSTGLVISCVNWRTCQTGVWDARRASSIRTGWRRDCRPSQTRRSRRAPARAK